MYLGTALNNLSRLYTHIYIHISIYVFILIINKKFLDTQRVVVEKIWKYVNSVLMYDILKKLFCIPSWN